MSQHAAGSSVSPSPGQGQAQQPGDPAAAAQAGQGGPQQAPKGHQGIDVFAMLPLDVVDTDAVFKCASAPWFGQALSLLAASGVHGVAVDVWWGAVERTPGDYKWTGYRQLVSLVKQAGLKMQAVMSFHACGGNTGDNAHISLPPWVLQCGKEDPDLFFTDRPRNGLGQRNREYLSIWASDARLLCGRTAYECYEDFMKAFREAFAQDLGDTIEEVVVGAGPCGELRFPSYPECHGWRFPGIGEFQCYDRHALASLAQAARAAGHPEWGYGGPHDAGHYNSAPEDTGFFSHAGNWDTPYGRFFLNWYSSCLLNHGERLLQMATRIFSASPARVQMATPRSNTSVAASSPLPGAPAALASSRSNKGAGSSTLVPGAYVLPAQQACQPSPGLASRAGRSEERAALVLLPPAASSLAAGEHGQAQQLQGGTHASPAQPAQQQQQQQPLVVATSSLQAMLHDSVLQCCAASMPAKSPGPSQQSLLSRDSGASTTSSVPVMLLGSEPGSEANMSASTLAAVPPATSAAVLAGLQQQQIPDPAAALVQRPLKAGFGASRMQQQQQHALTVPPEVVPAAPEPAGFECDLAALAIGQHQQQQQRGPGVSAGRTSSTSGGSSGLTVLTSGLGSTGILASAPAIIMPSQPLQSASPADGAMLSAGLSTLSASVMGPASPSPTALERPSGVSMYGAPSMTLVSSSTGTLSNCGSGGGGPPDTARSFVHDLCGGPPPRPHVSASCHSIPTLALTASPLRAGAGQTEAAASQHLGSLYLSEPVQSVAPASATPSPLASTCYYAPAAATGGVVSDGAVPLPQHALCGGNGAAASPPGAAGPIAPPETPTQPQGSGGGVVKHLASGSRGGEDMCAEQPQRRRRHVVLQADEEGVPGPSPVGICPRMRELGQSMGHLSISSSGSLSSAQELSELNSSEEVVQQRSSVDASCSTGSATLPSLGCISSTSPPSGSLLASAGGASSEPDRGAAGPAHAASGAAVVAAAAAPGSNAAGGSGGGRSRHQLTLSLKIPGVHWWYRSRSHAAELTAGYYNTATRDGYEPVVDLCARYGVALTLTCVEMCDGQHPLTAACSPEGLLKQVRVLTARRGVLLSGENALPIFLPQGGVDTVAMDRIVINTRAWYGPRAIESVASQHAALLAAQQSQWIRAQQQPLACHASLPMPRGSMWPALQPTYPGCTSNSVSNSGVGGPGAGMAGGWGYNGWHSGQCQYSGNVGGGSMPGSNSGSGVYDAGTLTTGPIYQREESSSSSGTGAGYGYGSGRGAGHGNIVGQGWGSGIGQGYGYGNCWPMASCPAGLHRNISASSADTALQQLHAAAGPHGGAWGMSNGAMGQAGSCHASASTSNMQPRAMSLGGGGGGGVDVPLGLPGEQHGVAACGLRTDSYADIKEPLPSMRSFTFLRLGPEIMLPGVLAPWLRFISGMQQGGYS